MASEATKLAVIGNKYILVRVIEVTELNCEVRSDLGPCYHWRTLIFRAIALLFFLTHTYLALVVYDKKPCLINSKCVLHSDAIFNLKISNMASHYGNRSMLHIS